MASETAAQLFGSYRRRSADALATVDASSVQAFADVLEQAWREGRRVFLFGNGGSATTAMHLAMDWQKTIASETGRPLRVICLCESVGSLLAYANDISFDEVFQAQLRTLMSPGDIVVALSGSGRSANVIRALQYARAQGAITVALCGFDGGVAKELAGLSVHVPVHDMQLAEDAHLAVGHVILKYLCGLRPTP